ncbi:hypothetical protein COV18_00370 [Candidatus Woesearchaeota archaeon CG10_big_fil_rev_8_21_14_0_10_37_12]|nr:MAG: hypothetical protein COV18_00370 [Candidatus Woesearchaeota archaeon CG10_big_fil_rev_8_21_14_0_10_37_12]
MIRSKKGFEISISMIVMLILGIILFTLSLYYLTNWFGEAEELQAVLDKQTEDQIINSLRIGNKLVAIPISVQTVTKGKRVSFGLGIRNVGDPRQFSVGIVFSKAYTPDGQTIEADEQFIQDNWLGRFTAMRGGMIMRNQQQVIPIGIRAYPNIGSGKATTNGDYTFNVCVYDTSLTANNEVPHPCPRTPDEFNPAEVYTGKVYQVTVRVV